MPRTKFSSIRIFTLLRRSPVVTQLTLRYIHSSTMLKRKSETKEVPPEKKKKLTEKEDSTDVQSKSSLDFIEKVQQHRKETASSVLQFKFVKKRVKILSKAEEFSDSAKGVVYWMSRDQRVQDNWAFLYAQRLALKLKLPLHVCFCLVPKFLDATIRHYGFLLKGLEDVEKECRELGIAFHLLIGAAGEVLPPFVRDNSIGGVVTDFSPLRVPAAWVEDVTEKLPEEVPFCQVDAHNIVPCWEASPKLEYGARTIRRKIHDQMSTYFTEFPPLIKHPHKVKEMPKRVDWEAAEKSLEVDRTVKEVDWAKPGTTAGLKKLEGFLKHKLKYFNADRNNPNKEAVSDMSPWYHFGQVSVQRAMLMVRQFKSKYKDSVDGYIEEGVIRRELSDNFCYYNEFYDDIKGAYEWARKTLNDHRNDKRKHVYSREQLEQAKTHDPLWNSAQNQMVHLGKMHGFLRMYWAKKILEWTDSPETALADAIYLNDKYSLDGRDPNGYVGCMWSICGIHDQGWKEREIFGKIRFMNYDGCKRKFDVAMFERKYSKNKLC